MGVVQQVVGFGMSTSHSITGASHHHDVLRLNTHKHTHTPNKNFSFVKLEYEWYLFILLSLVTEMLLNK